MARKVFYSFHYQPDCARAALVRNMGARRGCNKPAADHAKLGLKKKKITWRRRQGRLQKGGTLTISSLSLSFFFFFFFFYTARAVTSGVAP